MTARGLLTLLTAAALGLAAGCAPLPDDGPVSPGDAASPTSSAAPFDFDPPGPAAGATREQVVAGFLRALQATPPTTRVAEEFLTAQAAVEWQPDERTVVYRGQRLETRAGTVTARLDGAFGLDRSGRWTGPVDAGPTAALRFRLARDEGEWRIAELPDAMVIPESHFEARYREYSLHFFDPSGSVLVPEQVYLPWGVQAPTLLVEALLSGPSGAGRGAERSYFPRSTRLGVGVPVRADGVAEVPLSRHVQELDEDQLGLALAQLAWTLRQVPEIESLQVTVDGTPLELPGGTNVVDVDGWTEFSPAIADASTDLFGVRGKAVVQVVDGSEIDAATLSGAATGDPRSLGVDLAGQRFAVVAEDGQRVVVLSRIGERPRRPRLVYVGEDVLRPMWDRVGLIWLVDRARTGAVLQVVDDARVRQVSAPGLTGKAVVAAALSRDGTRLVVALAGRRGPDGSPGSRLVMLRVVRQGDGIPVRLTAARPMSVPQRLEGVRQLGWRDPTTVAVLTRPSATTSEVVLASADGSSGHVTLDSTLDVLFEPGVGLAASPGGPMALMVAARRGRVHELDPQGRWDLDFVAAGLRAPAFAG